MNCCSSKSLFGLAVTAGVALMLLGDGAALRAQAPDSSTQGAPQPLLSPEQLDDLVAPVALYPDPLLSQVLVACTYPLEVVEAQQWLQQNRALQGSQLMDAARQQNWDPSVQALVAFPDVLGKLNQDIRWTTDLGNAFLAQQADVMSAVQRMRARAQANGRLSTTQQQSVTTESQGSQSVIQIEPTNPEVIYVPSYDPMYVWGPPAWGYYPGLYYPSFGFGFGPGIDIGLCFGGWGGWGYGGWGWGWGPNWFGRSVFVNNVFFNRYGFRGGFGGRFGGGGFGGGGFGGRTVWAHDPSHRLGISYPNRQLAGRFQAASVASRAQRFGGQSFSNRSFGGNSFGGNRNTFQSGRQGGSQGYGGRSAFQGNQSYRGTSPQGAGRSYQSPGNFQSRQPSQSAPRSFAPSQGRSFGGGGARNFGGSAAPRYGSGGARSYSVAPSYGGGGARSFGGGGGARSSGGGGSGARSSGGGGHRR